MPIIARLIVNQAALKLKREAVQPLLDRAFAGARRRVTAHARRMTIRVRQLGFRRAASTPSCAARFEAAQDPTSTRSRRRDPRRRAKRAATRRCSSTRARFDRLRRVERARRSRSPRDELQARARRAAARAARRARDGRRTASARYHERQQRANRGASTTSRRQRARPAGHAARPRRRLRARRQGRVSVVGHHERVPGEGRRRARNRHGGAHAAAASAIRSCSPRPRLAGVDRVFTIGGAQAVGALAYGTATFPRSTRSSARATPTSPRRSGACSAWSASTWSPGPPRSSSSPTADSDPDWVAMDLFSQAEHDELAQAILLSPDARAPRRGRGEHRARCSPRCRGASVIAASLAGRGALIAVRDLDEACEIVQPHRARAPRARGRRPRSAAAADPPRRRDLPRALRVGSARRLLRRAQPRAADFAHARASPRRSASTTSRSARA